MAKSVVLINVHIIMIHACIFEQTAVILNSAPILLLPYVSADEKEKKKTLKKYIQYILTCRQNYLCDKAES